MSLAAIRDHAQLASWVNPSLTFPFEPPYLSFHLLASEWTTLTRGELKRRHPLHTPRRRPPKKSNLMGHRLSCTNRSHLLQCFPPRPSDCPILQRLQNQRIPKKRVNGLFLRKFGRRTVRVRNERTLPSHSKSLALT